MTAAKRTDIALKQLRELMTMAMNEETREQVAERAGDLASIVTRAQLILSYLKKEERYRR